MTRKKEILYTEFRSFRVWTARFLVLILGLGLGWFLSSFNIDDNQGVQTEKIIYREDLRNIESLDSICDRCVNGEWGGFCNEIFGWREELCVCDRHSEGDTGSCISARMNPKYLTKWEREELNQPIIKQNVSYWDGKIKFTEFCDDINGDGEIGSFECWGYDEEEYYLNLCDMKQNEGVK